MPTPTWPASLPQYPMVTGYSRAALSNMDSFKPEKGPEITGPLFANAGTNLNMSFRMTISQLQLFRAWWRVSVKGGAVPFYYLDPVEKTPKKYRLQSGQNVSETPSSGARFWTVTLALYEFP